MRPEKNLFAKFEYNEKNFSIFYLTEFGDFANSLFRIPNEDSFGLGSKRILYTRRNTLREAGEKSLKIRKAIKQRE